MDYDGAVYPCDRICSLGKDDWGNLISSKFSEIIFSDNAKIFRQKAAQFHEDCVDCKWKKHCNNGCVAMRAKNGKYRHCSSRKEVFEKINKIIKKINRKGMFVIATKESSKKKICKASILGAIRRVSEFPEIERAV